MVPTGRLIVCKAILNEPQQDGEFEEGMSPIEIVKKVKPSSDIQEHEVNSQ
jgi:hypothetical protein